MMLNLRLRDPKTRAVASEFGLTPQNRLGRGKFCAVYKKSEDRVYKLTSSAIQLESARDYFEGSHFPRFYTDYWCQGQQSHGALLYLYTAERLNKLRDADKSTKALSRLIYQKTQSAIGSKINLPSVVGASIQACEDLITDKDLPLSIREAFERVIDVCYDFADVILDIHGANFMVRGKDELILNDIVVRYSDFKTARVGY